MDFLEKSSRIFLTLFGRYFSFPLVFFALANLIFSVKSYSSIKNDQLKCTNVDLRKDLPANRNQGKIFWCYAHAAADLLTHHFKTPKISAADLALQFNSSFWGRLYGVFLSSSDVEQQFGIAEITINKALENGICTYHEFPDDYIWKKELKDSTNVWTKVDYLDGMNSIIKEYRSQLQAGSSTFQHSFRVGNLTEGQTQKVLLSSVPNRDVFDSFRDQSCKGKRIFLKESESYEVISTRDANYFYDEVHEQLTLGHPIVIDYFEDILFAGPQNYSRKLKEIHTSLIVGRKWNSDSKSCELLVRQSYGPHCKGYCIDGKCDPYFAALKCEMGNIWVSQKDLLGSIIQLTYLEK